MFDPPTGTTEAATRIHDTLSNREWERRCLYSYERSIARRAPEKRRLLFGSLVLAMLFGVLIPFTTFAILVALGAIRF